MSAQSERHLTAERIAKLLYTAEYGYDEDGDVIVPAVDLQVLCHIAQDAALLKAEAPAPAPAPSVKDCGWCRIGVPVNEFGNHIIKGYYGRGDGAIPCPLVAAQAAPPQAQGVAEEKLLERPPLERWLAYVNDSGTLLWRTIHYALALEAELAEAVSFRHNMEHANKLERDEAREECNRLRDALLNVRKRGLRLSLAETVGDCIKVFRGMEGIIDAALAPPSKEEL